jgi:4-hydroxy-2-oxoheptanedioate aldolase
MKFTINQFSSALIEKQKQIGLWVSLSNNYVAEVLTHAGYDWVLVDMEHSPNDLQTVLGQLQAFSQGKTTALVRPPWNDPVIVKRLLDLGTQGLLFPMIQSAEEAAFAVASTRYPPKGIRGVAGSSRATKFGRVKDYAQEVQAQTTVIMQLETRGALMNAEQIAEVDGVDAVFFGPADIAADIGLIGQPLSHQVWDLIMPVAEKLIAKGVPVGTLVLDSDFAIELLNKGFDFVACGADSALLANSADQLIANVKGGLL